MSSIANNFILVIKTLQGEPVERLTVRVRGDARHTEHVHLIKFQSACKSYLLRQRIELFVIQTDIDVGKIIELEFNSNRDSKVKQWKSDFLLLIHGSSVYSTENMQSSPLMLSDPSTFVRFVEPIHRTGESVYYAIIKTGQNSCSKDFRPKLCLHGSKQETTVLDIRSSNNHMINNQIPLQKNQIDIYQWTDHNVDYIENISLNSSVQNYATKYRWSIEWMYIIHHGYSFTGRISLNRNVKPNRLIEISLESSPTKNLNEQGDQIVMQKKGINEFIPKILMNNLQSNAVNDEIGRYYAIIRNLEGTNEKVYIEFYGENGESSGEQHLSHSENYLNEPFHAQHTDLFHIKALEVGRIQSASIRLETKDREQKLTLDFLYLIHNSVVYYFDLNGYVLNDQNTKVTVHPEAPFTTTSGRAHYFFATHTNERLLSNNHSAFKVLVHGTKATLGPLQLKDSLTNGEHAFEKQCIDLFHFEDIDIGDPVSLKITLEPTDVHENDSSGAKCDRMMMVKNNEFNSLWQIVGDLNMHQSKLISFRFRQIHALKDDNQNPIVEAEDVLRTNILSQVATPLNTHEEIEVIKNVRKSLEVVVEEESKQQDKTYLTIQDIQEHQKRHTFAANLAEAERNYRELRRLLKQVNRPIKQKSTTLMKQTVN